MGVGFYVEESVLCLATVTSYIFSVDSKYNHIISGGLLLGLGVRPKMIFLVRLTYASLDVAMQVGSGLHLEVVQNLAKAWKN